MGALENNVTVTISTSSPGLSRLGYGTMLILSGTAPVTPWGTGEIIRFYTDFAATALDWVITTPVYKAALAAFSQTPKPKKIAVGKLTLPPTQSYLFTPVVVDSTTYTVYLNGTAYSFTSGVGTTATLICNGIRTALGSPSGITVGGTTTLTLVSTTAGGWFSAYHLQPSLWDMTQNHIDPGVATDLAALKAASADWYDIINPWNSELMSKGVAAWAEANGKLFTAAMQETQGITVADGGATDTFHDIKVLAYKRTDMWFHPDSSQFLDAAIAGATLPLDPGSETRKFKNLSGVTPVVFTDTHRTNLTAKRTSWYETIGNGVTQGDAKVASGEYTDVIRGLDWFVNVLQTDIFNLQTANAKIPLDDDGIAMIAGKIQNALNLGVAQKFFRSYTMGELPKASAISDVDRAARVLNWSNAFTANLAGAVHLANITGNVTA